MGYKESGVVDSVIPKAGFQSISFKNCEGVFSNWDKVKKLSKGDIIDYNFVVKGDKGQFRNLTDFQIVTSTTKIASSPEPSFDKADTVKDKETNEIKSKIKEITISRGETVQFKEYEPTKFFVSMTAEYNPEDNPEKVCATLKDMVDTEINRQIINERELRKENGS